ncbi:hypothetical protein NC652_036167 [Populus alba x Populus x berolinensis]|nr:hypothetical protein NC652_036167 [Populus alba x Populus x berolinensis]
MLKSSVPVCFVGVDAEILRGLERAAINRIVLTLPERKKNVKLLFLSTVQIPNGHHIATVSHDRTIKLVKSHFYHQMALMCSAPEVSLYDYSSMLSAIC